MKLYLSMMAVVALQLGLTALPAQAGTITFYGTGTIQTYTAPTTGVYHLTAVGAEGNSSDTGFGGGLGASASGDYQLTAGTQLSIVVGGYGPVGDQIINYNGGGGGGSFIYEGSTVLLVAGGGGGGGHASAGIGSTQLGGTGLGGQGGTQTNGSNGGGGAGFNGSGTDGVNGTSGGGGKDAAEGFGGGSTPTNGGQGGFGGGGGGGGYQTGGGGGGGGYTGGNGGLGLDVSSGGGAGTSYFDSGFTNTSLIGATNTFDGTVIIVEPAVVPVPEPSTFLALGTGVLGLGLSRFFRKRAH